MAVLQIVATAEDRASGTLENLGRTGETSAKRLQVSWRKAALAAAAVGAGVEAWSRKMAPMREGLQRVAAATDMTEKETRRLAASMIDATFPMKDVIALMEQGRQQGLRTGEELERFARFWDKVGDATGESSDRLAEAGVALRAVGIAAGEQSRALASFGYITRETSVDVSDFLRFLGRAAPELNKLGVSVDDAAAMLGGLQEEGITGRVAIQEFRRAITEADGDSRKLVESLGLTTEQYERLRAAVAASEGVISKQAEIHGQNKTALQGWQARLSAFMLKHDEFLEGIGKGAPVLMATSAAIMAVTESVKLLKAAVVALMAVKGAKLLLFGGPVAAVAAVAGLGAYETHRTRKRETEEGQLRTKAWLEKGGYVDEPVDWKDEPRTLMDDPPRNKQDRDALRDRIHRGEVSMSGMFSGANINIASQGDAEALSQQIESAVGGYLRGMGVA